MHDFYRLLVFISILLFILIAALSLFRPSFLSELLDYVRIKMAARRLGLRDKGMMEPFIEDPHHEVESVMNHNFCYTRIRIGVMKNGSVTQYCWRCEQLGLENDESDFGPNDPDDGEPVLDDETPTQNWKNIKVVPIKPRKVA